MLIAQGLREADAAGAQAYVESTEAGASLYLKHGWVVCENFGIDLNLHGGQGVVQTMLMLREPQPLKQEQVSET